MHSPLIVDGGEQRNGAIHEMDKAQPEFVRQMARASERVEGLDGAEDRHALEPRLPCVSRWAIEL